jgi:hypothetical protein
MKFKIQDNGHKSKSTTTLFGSKAYAGSVIAICTMQLQNGQSEDSNAS